MSTEPNFGPGIDPNAAWCFGPIADPAGSIAGQQADYGRGLDRAGVAPLDGLPIGSGRIMIGQD